MRPWLVLTVLLVAGPAGAQTLQESVTAVWVHDVPGPPQGDFWDSAVGHLFSTFTNPASVYPDVMVCARPLNVATPHCSRICWDLKGDTHGNGQPSAECRQSLHVSLVPNDPRMLLEVLEMDHDGEGARVHAIIARNVVVSDPSRCTDDRPCRWSSSKGALVLSFSTQVHGVLGAPSPSSPMAPAPGGGSTTPTGPSLWQRAQEGAKKVAQRYAESKDPTASSRETVQRASAITQTSINSCLMTIAHNDDTLRTRMPACANLGGKAFEQCMYSKVLYDNDTALTQGYACSRQYQQEVDTLGRSAVYVWLKGQVCGIGQWIGLEVCQQ